MAFHRPGVFRQLGPLAGRLRFVEGLGADQLAQVTQPVEPDEHLAQEALETGWLAACLKHGHGHLGNGGFDRGQLERLVLIGQRQSRKFGVFWRQCFAARLGQGELKHAFDLLADFGEYRRRQAETGTDTTQHAGDKARRTRPIEHDHGRRVGGEHGPNGQQGFAKSGGLTAPGAARWRAIDAVERQFGGFLPAQYEAGGEIGEGQVLGRPAHRRLGKDQSNTGARVEPPGNCGRSGENVGSLPGSSGLPERRTTLAVPSMSVSRSSPLRGWKVPVVAATRVISVRTCRHCSSKASHGLRSRHCRSPSGLI